MAYRLPFLKQESIRKRYRGVIVTSKAKGAMKGRKLFPTPPFFCPSSVPGLAVAGERESEWGGEMKGCELCHRVASLYCKSDQASLCWECDAKVHGANFLVARHGRSLLCRSCQAPTPWRAAGARFSPTISVCENCAALGKMASDWERDEEEGEAQGIRGGEADRMMQDEDADHQDDLDDEKEEEGESQVVPWKLASLPAASSSSGEGFSSTDSGSAMFLKRIRENADLDSSDFPSPSSNRSQLDTSRLMPAPSPSRSDDQVADSTVSASFRSSKARQRSIFRSDARPS